MAMSVNGIIAKNDNSEDFLSDKNWETLVDLAKGAGCVIFGRKTYELLKTWDKKYLDSLKDINKIVVTTDRNYSDDDITVAYYPHEAIAIARTTFSSETAILSGGAKLNSSFAEQNLIDEIIFNIEPVLIGNGIPVFNPEDFENKLELIEQKKIGDLVQLHYKLKK